MHDCMGWSQSEVLADMEVRACVHGLALFRFQGTSPGIFYSPHGTPDEEAAPCAPPMQQLVDLAPQSNRFDIVLVVPLCCPRSFAQKRATAAGSRDAKRKAKMAGVTTVVLKSNVRKFTRRR